MTLALNNNYFFRPHLHVRVGVKTESLFCWTKVRKGTDSSVVLVHAWRELLKTRSEFTHVLR